MAIDGEAEPSHSAGFSALRAAWSVVPAQERLCNAAFALSALLAAVMRLAVTPASQWHLPAVVGVAAINALIGVLFLVRRPVLAVGTSRELLSCLPTIVGFGLAVRLAGPPPEWPWLVHGLFGTGVLLTVASFVNLGASFAVLPALRRVIDCGPYRFVRHPAYAGELIMAAACFAAAPSWLAGLPWLLLAPGVAWRISAEERVLSGDEAYAEYRRKVRWRLIPWIW